MSSYAFDIDALREGETPSRSRMALIVLALSAPAILAELSTTLMQYIDAAMVGSLGAHATASIGLVESTLWMLNGLAMCAGAGFTVQVAQLIGAGRDMEARNVFRQAMVTIGILGLVFAATGIAISGSLPVWLRVCSFSLIPISIARLGTGMLQCSGDMRTPSLLNVLSCALNVCLNAVLIHEGPVLAIGALELPVPGMGLGIAGAAYGTLIAQAVTAALLIWFSCTRSERLALRPGGIWMPQRSTLVPAWHITWPLFIERIVTQSAYVVITAIVAPLGVVAVAANSLAITVEAVCYMPGFGIGAAATTLVGQAVGAERKDVARSFSRLSTLLGMGVMAIMGVLMYVAAPPIMAMLTPDVAVQELGVTVLRIEAFAEPLFAASLVASGAMRGAGDTLVPSIFSLVSMWGVRITLATIAAPRWGLVGVWVVMAGELCFRGVLFLVRLLRDRWLDHQLSME